MISLKTINYNRQRSYEIIRFIVGLLLFLHRRSNTKSPKLTVLSLLLKTASKFFGSGLFAMGRSGYRKRQYYFVLPYRIRLLKDSQYRDKIV